MPSNDWIIGQLFNWIDMEDSDCGLILSIVLNLPWRSERTSNKHQ